MRVCSYLHDDGSKCFTFHPVFVAEAGAALLLGGHWERLRCHPYLFRPQGRTRAPGDGCSLFVHPVAASSVVFASFTASSLPYGAISSFIFNINYHFSHIAPMSSPALQEIPYLLQ